MKIISNQSKEQWNQFVMENNGSFLQSWQWGEFQQSLGRKIWRIETAGLKALIIKHNLPLRKNYLYCPRGPVFEASASQFKIFLEEVKKIAQQEKSVFLKIEPDINFRFQITDYGFVKSLKQIQPSQSLILNLDKSKEELLGQMHQKTRYNIRLAERQGVKIIFDSHASEYLQNFLELLEQTAKRDKFRLHPKEYYQKMLEILDKQGMVKLFLAQYQNKVIAANLVCFFGQTVSYLHGASDYAFRQLMAPHLLQWQTILEAKKLGFKYYDFLGINGQRWPGMTRFKKGFGGQEIAYPGAFDLIFQPGWYQVYNLARKIL